MGGRRTGGIPARAGLLLALSWCLILPKGAPAQTIGGSAEWSFFDAESTSESASGPATESTTRSFLQRYRLSLIAPLTAKVALDAGGIFERSDSETESGGSESRSAFTRIMPRVALRLGDPFFALEGSYTKRADISDVEGLPKFESFQDTYGAAFSLKPTDLPTLDLRYTKSLRYDRDRLFENSVTDFVGVSSRYAPTKDLHLRYNAAFSSQENRLQEVETERANHTAKIDYNTRFLDNRGQFNAGYQASYGTSKTTARGEGPVRIPIAGFLTGLSRSDGPASPPPTQGNLSVNLALTDGDPTASAGVNLGQGASLAVPPVLNWEIGLDLAFPRELNLLFVAVDNDVSPVASRFSWDVYVSQATSASDPNQTWTLFQSNAPSVFNPFDRRFEIAFPNVATRFIKVVVSPLPAVLVPPPPPGTDFTNVNVTEIEPLISRPASEVTGRDSQTSQKIDLNARLLLVDIPAVHYNVNFSYRRSDPGGVYSYTLYNSVTAYHTFSRIFSGNALIGLTYDVDPRRTNTEYLFTAGLTAVPLKALAHTLVLGGRIQESGGESTRSVSANLSNVAQLYGGVSLFLSGGGSLLETEAGRRSQAANVSGGTSITPRPDLSLSVIGSLNRSDQSGGGLAETSSTQRATNLSASWQPFRTLYLAASYDIFSTTGTPRATTESYTLNFSPFPGGALQFNLAYNEGRQEPEGAKFKSIAPSVLWAIGPRTTLTVSYRVDRDERPSGRGEQDTWGATLRTSF